MLWVCIELRHRGMAHCLQGLIAWHDLCRGASCMPGVGGHDESDNGHLCL